MSGIPTSSSATSGFSRAASSTASRPPEARPTTSIRGSAASSAAVPSRISRWSSAMITRTGVVSRRDRSGGPQRAGRGLARVARARRHRASCRCWRAPRWRRCARRCACDDAALYLPDADGHPVLRRYVGDAAAEELSFDEEAWQLAIASGAPIVLREPATLARREPVHAARARLGDPAAGHRRARDGRRRDRQRAPRRSGSTR